MATPSNSSGSARTAPKGHATKARNEDNARRSRLPPTMEWVIVVIAIVLVIAAIFFFLGDIRSTLGGSSGAPADVVDVTPFSR